MEQRQDIIGAIDFPVMGICARSHLTTAKRDPAAEVLAWFRGELGMELGLYADGIEAPEK